MHKAMVRFGFVHLVATNICIWSMVTVNETNEAMYQHNGVLVDKEEEPYQVTTWSPTTMFPNSTDNTSNVTGTKHLFMEILI